MEDLREHVQQLLGERRARYARSLISRELSKPANRAKNKQATLLDILLDIETYAGRPRDVLKVLERRRSLGYSDFSQAASASLLAGLLLLQTGQSCAARDELTHLLRDRRTVRLSGPGLDALAAYVDADQQCRDDMRALLERGYKSEIRRLGIADVASNAAIEDRIRQARSTLRASRKVYQQLVVRALSGDARRTDSTLVQDLEEFRRTTPIAFFQGEAEKLLRSMRPKEGRESRSKRSPSRSKSPRSKK